MIYMRIVINPKYDFLKEQIKSIPNLFEEKGEIIYDGRNLLKREIINGVDVVVKSFKKPHLFNRVVYSFFRKSKASRSYLFSNEIIDRGFYSPEPIAVIEQYSYSLLTRSYYICRYDNGETVRYLMDGVVAGNEDKLKAFARYTAELHNASILHLDYSPGNILIRSTKNGYEFSLVDVNRMRIVPSIDCETACKNMSRLCISQEVLSYIMTEYALIRGWDVKSTVNLSLYYTSQFFKRYLFHRAAKKETTKHIISYILVFRFMRSLRSIIPLPSNITSLLWKKEKDIYDTFLSKYDYCNLLSSDYN